MGRVVNIIFVSIKVRPEGTGLGLAIYFFLELDFFWGFGDEAGELAGRMKQGLFMWVLLPRSLALPQN